MRVTVPPTPVSKLSFTGGYLKWAEPI
jgi:hypothetical protein